MLGVVCVWTGLPDEEVFHQYNPFITPYPAASGLPTPGDPGCPAVWVGDVAGVGLSRLAASGQASATLVLTADITGGFDWSTTYAMRRNPLNIANAEQDAYLSAVAAVNASGWPDYPVAAVRPGPIPLYLGEGAPLYAAGLGTVSLCPLPTYLLQAGDAQHPALLDLDKLDKHLMYGQILTFARAIQALDATPPTSL